MTGVMQGGKLYHVLKCTLSAVVIVLLMHRSANATVPISQDFQTQAVASASKTITLSYSFPALSVAPRFSLAYSVDFSLGAPSCSGSAGINCTIAVSFGPQSPGLKQNALLVFDSSNNLLATTLLHGIGQAPQAVIHPGVITTSAGTGGFGFAGDGGPANQSLLADPQAIATDAAGNVYIADSTNQVIRKISNGIITTIAGSTAGGVTAAGYSGDGGLAVNAKLNTPTAVAIDGASNLYIADTGNNVIRKVDPAGRISTFAGGGAAPSGGDGLGDGGPATAAILSGPSDVAVDSTGNVYIADSLHGLIRQVDSSGKIWIVAGGGAGGGWDGLGDGGTATGAVLDNPSGIALDAGGNLYISDTGHQMIRCVTSGVITAVAGIPGTQGYRGDGDLATQAELNNPRGIRLDAAGDVYIADSGNNVVREILAGSGNIITIAGNGTSGYSGDNGSPLTAELATPMSVAIDNARNVLIADDANNVIRKLQLTAQPLSFGSVNVGAISSTQSEFVFNIGNQSLSLITLNVGLSFKQEASGTLDCSAATVVLPGLECGIGVAFVPAKLGQANTSLSFTTNSLNVTGTAQSTSLEGTGVSGPYPLLTTTSTSVSFGNQNLGTISTAKLVTVTNSGSASLIIGGIVITGPDSADFSPGTCPNILAPGSSCSLSITFAPGGLGLRSASIGLTDNLPSSPQTISLTGTGIASGVASFNTGLLTFPGQVLGMLGIAQTLTVSNTGSAPMSIASLSLQGLNAADFSINTNCGSLIAAQSSCTVTVSFSPSALGIRNASLVFTDSAQDSPQSVSVMGYALPIKVPGKTGISIDGDQKKNIGIYRALDNSWWIVHSGGSWYTTRWGIPGDIPIPADYDGDRRTDMAVYRPSDNSWRIMPSSAGGWYTTRWGVPGDIPVPADYDGDGKVDIAVYRPSDNSWWIVLSGTGQWYTTRWGIPGDVPVPGDYDGDGTADIAVYRPSDNSWWVVLSSTGQWYTTRCGTPGDIPVPADYDGDGKVDIAVYRPSDNSWWIVLSSTGEWYTTRWGLPGDIPIPGDYDGDGRADIAVYRPSDNSWWAVLSSTGQCYMTHWGISGDVPLS
jgi:hypothetical protein